MDGHIPQNFDAKHFLNGAWSRMPVEPRAEDQFTHNSAFEGPIRPRANPKHQNEQANINSTAFHRTSCFSRSLVRHSHPVRLFARAFCVCAIFFAAHAIFLPRLFVFVSFIVTCT